MYSALGLHHGNVEVHLVTRRFLECEWGHGGLDENLRDQRLQQALRGIQEFERLSLNDKLDFFRAV